MTSTTYCRPCDAHHDEFGIPSCTASDLPRRKDVPAEADVILYVGVAMPVVVLAIIFLLLVVF